ncbi:hypothetical protein [Maliponia aquimaris]|uniref:Uncharacterized protein n=1 Tax=Maliponia aquimaris TaxID=1673631 RepID=A0A238K8J9_9RHOB|nr:hypothetical protein [Maliponia aquimaris]SMX38412.1 hypothetical protein MAA8898_01590 [Maliponia aquimaris]
MPLQGEPGDPMWTAYRLNNDTEFRPQMMQAAIDTARAQAARRPQIPQEH